jgi:hypothetical protein
MIGLPTVAIRLWTASGSICPISRFCVPISCSTGMITAWATVRPKISAIIRYTKPAPLRTEYQLQCTAIRPM